MVTLSVRKNINEHINGPKLVRIDSRVTINLYAICDDSSEENNRQKESKCFIFNNKEVKTKVLPPIPLPVAPRKMSIKKHKYLNKLGIPTLPSRRSEDNPIPIVN